MDIDFSKLNLQYLVRARDLAQIDRELAAGLLGVSSEVVSLLASASPEHLAALATIKVPLVVPRGERWWWIRLLEVIAEGDADELQSVLEHAGLILAT
jgi:hypothetical protein